MLPRVSPSVAAERIGDGMVVVHLETNQIYELNPTAARLFEMLREGESREAILTTLASEYELAGVDLARELDELLAGLLERGIVA